MRRVARENERLVSWSAEVAPPGSEEGDEVGGEVDVAAFVVLGRAQVTVGDRAPHPGDRLGEVDVRPGEGEQLALSHTRLQSELEQDHRDSRRELGEEAGQFLVGEVGGLLADRSRPLGPGELPDGVSGRVPVGDGGGEAGAQDAQVLRPGRGGDASLAQEDVEASNVLGLQPSHDFPPEEFACVGDGGAVAGDRRLLPLERAEPAFAPVREPDRRLWDVGALVDAGLDAGEGAFCLAAVLAGALAVELASFADDDVVGGSTRAGASLRSICVRRPGFAEGAGAGVSGLQAGHQGFVGRTTLPPRPVSITSRGAPSSQASSSSWRKRQRRPPGEAAVGDGASAGELVDGAPGAAQPAGDVLDEEVGTERLRQHLTHEQSMKHICFA